MNGFLDTLAMDAAITIDGQYYQTQASSKHQKVGLKQAILNCKTNPVLTEIKAASPSAGTLKSDLNPSEIAQAMEKGGASAISVLTEPKHFHGSLSTLSKAREATKLPILMKDIVIAADQIEAGAKLGADAVLLIQALFDRRCCEMSLERMIAFAHSQELEVLLETHTEEEFKKALETEADLIGINNRNLATLKIDLYTTKQILEKNRSPGKLIVSESGIKIQADLRFLRGCGANAFLIGSSIMQCNDVEGRVREFVLA